MFDDALSCLYYIPWMVGKCNMNMKHWQNDTEGKLLTL